MINQNLYIFVAYRSYLLMLGRFFSNRLNPLRLLISLLAVFRGFYKLITFVLKADLYSHSASKFDQVSNHKNEFSKYKQREHPSNDQLPSTRQGLHSIPNIPVKEHGGFLDCTKGNLLEITVALILSYGDEY